MNAQVIEEDCRRESGGGKNEFQSEQVEEGAAREARGPPLTVHSSDSSCAS